MSIKNPAKYIKQFENLNNQVLNYCKHKGFTNPDAFLEVFDNRIEMLRENLGDIQFDQDNGTLIRDKITAAPAPAAEIKIGHDTAQFMMAVETCYGKNFADDILLGYKEAKSQIAATELCSPIANILDTIKENKTIPESMSYKLN